MKEQNFSIPLAIIAAGFIIAIALVFAKSSGPKEAAVITAGEPQDKIDIKLTNDDHILGNLQAKIKIVEFSDLECPFCKNFHSVMQQVVNDYDGQVAWIYKHFPLDSLHPKARKEAEATECAAEQGKFWEYTDRLLEITPSNNGLDLDQLPQIAEELNLDLAQFNACLDSEKYAGKIEDHYRQAVQAGAAGTPYSVLIDENGDTQAINGALPYSSIQIMIDSVLK